MASSEHRSSGSSLAHLPPVCNTSASDFVLEKPARVIPTRKVLPPYPSLSLPLCFPLWILHPPYSEISFPFHLSFRSQWTCSLSCLGSCQPAGGRPITTGRTRCFSTGTVWTPGLMDFLTQLRSRPWLKSLVRLHCPTSCSLF